MWSTTTASTICRDHRINDLSGELLTITEALEEAIETAAATESADAPSLASAAPPAWTANQNITLRHALASGMLSWAQIRTLLPEHAHERLQDRLSYVNAVRSRRGEEPWLALNKAKKALNKAKKRAGEAPAEAGRAKKKSKKRVQPETKETKAEKAAATARKAEEKRPSAEPSWAAEGGGSAGHRWPEPMRQPASSRPG